MHIRAIILVVAALTVAVEAQQPPYLVTFLSYLFRPILEYFIQRTCRAIFDNFNDGYRLGCRCKGVYNDGSSGIGGQIKCQIDDPFCLIDHPFQVYCGEVTIVATFNTQEGITKIKSCIDITSDFPKDFPLDDITQFPRACVSVVPTNEEFLTFESCEIKFDDQVCSSCIVCESQRDFTFDCSNVNVNPAQDVDQIFIAGPAAECVGFSFLFGTNPPIVAPAAPVLPPFFTPVNLPVQSPTNFTITAAPVAIPVSSPTSPVTTPVSAPVTPPITPPVTVPVTPPVNASAPAPMIPPVAAPVTPPVNASAPVPVTPPVAAPVTPPANASAPVAVPSGGR